MLIFCDHEIRNLLVLKKECDLEIVPTVLLEYIDLVLKADWCLEIGEISLELCLKKINTIYFNIDIILSISSYRIAD